MCSKRKRPLLLTLRPEQYRRTLCKEPSPNPCTEANSSPPPIQVPQITMDERKRTYEPSDSGPGHTKRLKPGVFPFCCCFAMLVSELASSIATEDILGTIKDDPNRVVTRLFLTTKQYSKVIGKGGMSTTCHGFSTPMFLTFMTEIQTTRSNDHADSPLNGCKPSVH